MGVFPSFGHDQNIQFDSAKMMLLLVKVGSTTQIHLGDSINSALVTEV